VVVWSLKLSSAQTVVVVDEVKEWIDSMGDASMTLSAFPFILLTEIDKPGPCVTWHLECHLS
jgi:hypothetical protein